MKLQALHQDTGTPTSEVERAQLNSGLNQDDAQAHLLATYAALVSGAQRRPGFVLSNRASVTGNVHTGRRKPAVCVRA